MNTATMKTVAMKTPAALLLPAVFLLSTMGAQAEQVSRTTDIDGVTAIELKGYATLTIRQGDKEFVKVTTDDDIIDDINVEVSGHTLVLSRNNQPKGWFHRNGEDDINFEVQVKSLSSFENSGASKVSLEPFNIDGDFELVNSGAGKIEVTKLKAERLEIDSDGAGEIKLKDIRAERVYSTNNGAGHVVFNGIEADSLEVTVNGAAEVNFQGSGKVDELELGIHGVGEVDALSVVAQHAKVEIHGAGSVLLNARQKLDAGIYGAGSIRYQGDPEVAQTIRGAGVVKTYR